MTKWKLNIFAALEKLRFSSLLKLDFLFVFNVHFILESTYFRGWRIPTVFKVALLQSHWFSQPSGNYYQKSSAILAIFPFQTNACIRPFTVDRKPIKMSHLAFTSAFKKKKSEKYHTVRKIQVWFSEKIIDFFEWKTRENVVGLGLFSCWQLWFHEKNCEKKIWVKIFLDKNMTFRIMWIWDFLEYFLNTVCLILHWLHSEKFCRWINGSDPTKSLLIRLIQRFHGLFLGHLYPQIFLKVIILFSRRKKKCFFDLEHFSSYFCRHFRQLLATKCTGSFSRTWRFSQTNYGDSRGVWSGRVSSAFM